ncbi:MAG: PSD1 and planctomycete cytochrome C domain-containing protein [Pirellula sp.]
MAADDLKCNGHFPPPTTLNPQPNPVLRSLICSTVLMAMATLVGSSQISASDPIQFNRDIRPILSENCLACHGFDAAKREAGLRLDTRQGATVTLESGAVAIQPGKPEQSELIRRILSQDTDEVMPPSHSGKHLSDKQRTMLKNWVEQGAEYDKHWAFLPPVRALIPTLSKTPADLATHPIDRFICAKLEANSLAPSESADSVTLIRRVSLDLTGLPPTPKEVAAFVQEASMDSEAAYASLVDRLLRSPSYGERWGRWWLDQARYADSNGYSVDAPRQIWKYRDWVVDALNRDLPINQFIIHQLAGDLLPDATEEQKIATGFHRNTQINQEGGIDVEQFRMDSIFDRVATTGSVFLGLTIGCAQCHDHKFDPITQKEYYRLFAFLNNQDEPNLMVYPPELIASELLAEKKKLESAKREIISKRQADLDEWESELTDEEKKALSTETKKALGTDKAKRSTIHKETLYTASIGSSDSEFATLKDRTKRIDKQLEQGIPTMVMSELSTPRKTTILIKGDFTRPSEEVTCGTPSVLHPLESRKDSLNRLDLAEWIVSPKNPLTARVFVNRVWQQLFGKGIVETDNDFGLQGAVPSHPELLDWLALQFIDDGWSLKKLHMAIVTTRTYRQKSVERPDILERDRDNYLLAKQNRLRLDAEIVRDMGLAASGLLSSKMGGPPVFPPIPDGVMTQGQVKREWKVSPGEDKYRRGLYTFVYRATPPPSLNVFDAPEGNSTCTRRIRSNTPLQALTLLNDAAFFEFAQSLEKVIEKEGLPTAFQRCTSRLPKDDEMEILNQLDRLSAARVLLNLDETVTRE